MAKQRGSFMWILVVLLQLVGTQVFTFMAAFIFPQMNLPEKSGWLMAAVLTVTFALGVFLAGWLGYKLRWLTSEWKLLYRLIGSLLGAFLPLLAGMLINGRLETGSPFFAMATLTTILGFYVPTWVKK